MKKYMRFSLAILFGAQAAIAGVVPPKMESAAVLSTYFQAVVDHSKNINELLLYVPMPIELKTQITKMANEEKISQASLPKLTLGTRLDGFMIQGNGTNPEIRVSITNKRVEIGERSIPITDNLSLKKLLDFMSEKKSASRLPGFLYWLLYEDSVQAQPSLLFGLVSAILIVGGIDQFTCDVRRQKICLFGKDYQKESEEVLKTKYPHLEDASLARLYMDLNLVTEFTCLNKTVYSQTGDLHHASLVADIVADHKARLRNKHANREDETRTTKDKISQLPPLTRYVFSHEKGKISGLELFSSEFGDCKFKVVNDLFELETRSANPNCSVISKKIATVQAQQQGQPYALETTLLSALGIDIKTANACCASKCKDLIALALAVGKDPNQRQFDRGERSERK